MKRLAMILLALCGWVSLASAQGNICRTSPPGTSSSYCASEAFVSSVATGQPVAPLVLANGVNSDITLPANTYSFLRITGPTGAFSISGFVGGTDGRVLYVYNVTTFQMTLLNNNASSLGKNRLNTLQAADIVLRVGQSFATLIYDKTLQRWVVMGVN